MNQVSLEGRSVLGVCAAALVLLAALFAWPGEAGAAQPYGAGGVVNACYKAKGKERGALRLVKSSRGCKRMRGWRRVSWGAVGPPGASAPTESGATGNGQHGPVGPTGPAGQTGPQGEPGAPGLVGGVEQSLLDTIQNQADQIAALTAQVNGLTGDLGDVEGLVNGLSGDVTDLEGVVAGACDQIDLLSEQSDSLLDAIGGLSILGGIVELIIPSLPDPLGTFEGCTA